MNLAVLLSGGSGSRLGLDIPKQYIRLGGAMMITRALLALSSSGHVDGVMVVADERWRGDIRADAEAAGHGAESIMGFAEPGENRQLSIVNGIEAAVELMGGIGEADTVFIHDAARPFLSRELISACYGALSGHDGVLPTLPMKDTVYESADGVGITRLLERKNIFAGQAPELFLLKKYAEANKRLSKDELLRINGSTEPAVLAGMDIVMIPGDEGNFKITTAADLERARRIIEGERH